MSKLLQKTLADPSHELLRKYSIKSHFLANVTKAKGDTSTSDDKVCKVCGGTGYKGRVGVYEVLKIDDEIRNLILSEKSADEIRDRSRERGMRTLLEYGMEMVRQGTSTIEEVQRVCVLERDDEDEDQIFKKSNE